MTEHVPSAAELAHIGLAQVVTPPKGSASGTYRVSDAGHRLMGDAMRANADAAIARGEGNWTEPPSNDGVLAAEHNPKGDDYDWMQVG